jgi:DNA invertase Pin-like site-specific DNA recombinase
VSPDRTPRCYGYGRASTKHQVESPETQKETIREYAKFHKLGDVTVFLDRAKSGKIPWDERPAGCEMFKQIRRGDHVIITKLDRAFRKLSDCVAVLERFQRMGVNLHVCNLLGGALDLSAPIGKFLICILAAFAELERSFISERVRDGMEGRKKRGLQHCHYPGYGFRWEKRNIGGKYERVRVRDDDEREVMRSIVQWRTSTPAWSWDAIREHLTYTLKLKTKEGKQWDVNRIKRACLAELKLQYQEQKGLS